MTQLLSVSASALKPPCSHNPLGCVRILAQGCTISTIHTYWGPREANQRHLSLQFVPCQCDGLEDIAELCSHIYLLPKFQQVLDLLQWLREAGALARHHHYLHAQCLEREQDAVCGGGRESPDGTI